MGEISFTPLQQSVFNSIIQHPDLPNTFYFTGGTALGEVKDFVDLYLLLKEFTVWDLMYSVKKI